MGAVPRFRLIRYAGFGGAVLLAVAAWLGGALPDSDLKATPLSILRGDHGVVILGGWLIGTGLLAGAWWAARAEVPSVRWVTVTAALWLLPLALAPPMGSRDVYSYACQGATYAAGLDPYEVGVSALPCPWLGSISMIWRDTPAPYGPLFLLLSGAILELTGSLPVIIVLFRLVAVAGLVLAAACLPVLARRCGVPVPRALWLGLAGPVVGVHLVGGAHNDALMVGLLLAGLAVVVSRPGRAGALLAGGVLLGLAVAVKATAVVVLPFAALAGLVGPYRFPAVVRAGSWLAAGAVGALGATTLLSGVGLGWIAGLSRSGDTVQWTSPPTAVGMTVLYVGRVFGAEIDGVPAARVVAVLILPFVLLALWWRARPEPDLPARAPLHGAWLALVATVALAPVFHAWYLAWPLALLAVSAAPADWFLRICAAACFLVPPDGSGLARLVKFPGAPLMTIAVVVLLVRHVRRVRSGGHRPPAAGHGTGSAAPAAGAALP